MLGQASALRGCLRIPLRERTSSWRGRPRCVDACASRYANASYGFWAVLTTSCTSAAQWRCRESPILSTATASCASRNNGFWAVLRFRDNVCRAVLRSQPHHKRMSCKTVPNERQNVPNERQNGSPKRRNMYRNYRAETQKRTKTTRHVACAVSVAILAPLPPLTLIPADLDGGRSERSKYARIFENGSIGAEHEPARAPRRKLLGDFWAKNKI